MERMDRVIFDTLFCLLENKEIKPLRALLNDMNEMDVAAFLEELPDHKTTVVFRMLPKEQAAEVFAFLTVEKQKSIIDAITDTELSNIIEELFVDDAVDMLEELPANVVKRVMKSATSETRNLINQFLQYPENSAGSIMTAEFLDLKKQMSVQGAFDRIRKIGADKETIYTCYVTNANRQLEGVVTVRDLLLSPMDAIIADIMDTNFISATTTDDQEAVSKLFSKYDLLSIPIVDRENRLVGIVTVDDVLDIIAQEATKDFEIMAAISPSEKPYLKSSVWDLSRNRILWLLVLMLSSTITGSILLHFEGAFAVLPLLVSFIPQLTNTGGNAGSQSATLVIRGMALGEIKVSNILQVFWKEIRVSLLVGVVLAAVNFLRIIIMYPGSPYLISLVVSLSLLATVMIAKAIGCVLPIVAKKCGLDPAIMSAPLLTTIVDACSLFIYFRFAVSLLPLH